MTEVKWKKSSRSNAGGDCVEVATPSQAVMVRDSKDQQGPVLHFAPAPWATFLKTIKAGAFTA
ncbi:DUF397 domain-containing protein [Micromonospora carbonacea]|uniref:DUF397 domain-containing protein n=1 Tax=Micromonospora carbonacea TaxID=47853 RepID=A0A7H8XTU8_9ACTN|nr:DUF397 domain-containing protein [Micromonospora carbonacea]MBB5823887.1 hypothetical protein [Micromonospora carbonacea]QLD27838.1 DUF397 domain-containing protein [Micromonospora carbonacea]